MRSTSHARYPRDVNASSKSSRVSRGREARVLRIVGGGWRGRRWRFPATEAIRPTPDRVRETLFNWLGPGLAGSRCLDLFAGSGALGLEALSRGAAHVTFVEQDAQAARQLRALLSDWGAHDAQVERADALLFLGRRSAAPYDVVFLDPPFGSALLGSAAAALEAGRWLAPGARIYVESAARSPLPDLPPGWRLHRGKRAGEVGYYLFEGVFEGLEGGSDAR